MSVQDFSGKYSKSVWVSKDPSTGVHRIKSENSTVYILYIYERRSKEEEKNQDQTLY